MGEVMEYLPSLDEILISVGILAVGAIVFTISANVGLHGQGADTGGTRQLRG